MDETSENITKISVFTPILYVTAVVTALIIFSVSYRKKKLANLSKRQLFFGENIPKDIYFQLKQLKETEKVNEKVMKAALMRRGAECIRRSIKLQEITPFMTTLYQQSAISDEYWDSFQFAKKVEELELKEIFQEVETLKKNWSKSFLPLLQEICFNEALTRRFLSIPERSKDLIKLWELPADSATVAK